MAPLLDRVCVCHYAHAFPVHFSFIQSFAAFRALPRAFCPVVCLQARKDRFKWASDRGPVLAAQRVCRLLASARRHYRTFELKAGEAEEMAEWEKEELEEGQAWLERFQLDAHFEFDVEHADSRGNPELWYSFAMGVKIQEREGGSGEGTATSWKVEAKPVIRGKGGWTMTKGRRNGQRS